MKGFTELEFMDLLNDIFLQYDTVLNFIKEAGVPGQNDKERDYWRGQRDAIESIWSMLTMRLAGEWIGTPKVLTSSQFDLRKEVNEE